MLSLAAFGGVVFFGVLAGIVVAIVLSILLFFHRSWWPNGAVLGRVEGSRGLAQLDARARGRGASKGCSSIRWEAPLFFANAGHVPPADSSQRSAAAARSWVVLQCEAITDIDVTAADMLERLDNGAQRRWGCTWPSSSCGRRLHDLVYSYGLFETLDRDHFYDTIDDAMDAIDSRDRDDTSGSR